MKLLDLLQKQTRESVQYVHVDNMQTEKMNLPGIMYISQISTHNINIA